MDIFGLILTLVVIAIVLGIAWWIVIQIPMLGGPSNWLLRVIFGLVCLLVVIALFTGNIPMFSFKR